MNALTLAVDGTPRVMFGGAYVVDQFTLVLTGLFLLTGYVVVLLSSTVPRACVQAQLPVSPYEKPMAANHYENFPVASVLLPAYLRRPVELIYAFARQADDFADEGDWPESVRLANLAGFMQQLDLVERELAFGVEIDALPVVWAHHEYAVMYKEIGRAHV